MSSLESFMTHVASNGCKLIIHSWPRPIRSPRGKVRGYDYTDLYTGIYLAVSSQEDSWRNPELLNGQGDLDLNEENGNDENHVRHVRESLREDLARLLEALGCPEDLHKVHALVYESRDMVRRSAIVAGVLDEQTVA